MADAPTYKILDDVATSFFDNNLNRGQTGRKLTVQSLKTGRVLLVNVPDAAYTVEGVNTAVLAAIKNSDAIADLGQA